MDFPLSPRSQQGTRCPPATPYPTPQPPRRGGATAGVSLPSTSERLEPGLFLHERSQVTLTLQTEAQDEPDSPDKAPLCAKGKGRRDGNTGPWRPAA